MYIIIIFYNTLPRENDLKPTTEEQSSGSYKEFYVNKLLTTMLDNLSISCKTIIIKHTESNVVMQIDVKSFKITPANDDWTMNYDDAGTQALKKKIYNHLQRYPRIVLLP